MTPPTSLKIYYAHSVSLYNTPQELRDIELLERLGFEVFNPNQPACNAGYQAEGMKYFERVLDDCDALAFRANPGGSINAGVVKEINYMIVQGAPVIELPTLVGRQYLSVEDTRAYLKEVGNR